MSNSSISIPSSPFNSDNEDESITVTTVRQRTSEDTYSCKPKPIQRQSHIIASTSPTHNSHSLISQNDKAAPVTAMKKKRPHSAVTPGPTKTKPFEMTRREEQKRKENKLASEYLTRDVDATVDQKIKQFKAIEMPSHVKEKRYEKIVRNQEEKKQKAKVEALKAIQTKMKPFSFIEREQKKYQIKRSISSPNLTMKSTKPDFEATPYPEHIFTNFASERRIEKENYRCIQKKLRQEMLLKKSHFPPRMESEFIKKKLQENKNSTQIQSQEKKIARREKTDLDRLYREYKAKIELKEENREHDENVKKRIEKKKPRPSSADGAYHRRFYAITMGTEKDQVGLESSYNLTTQLRMKLLDENRHKQMKREFEKDKLEKERDDRLRRRKLNNPVWENIKTEKMNRDPEQMKDEKIQEDKIRSKDYKLELIEMMARVENQPTLFQKQSQVKQFSFFINLLVYFAAKCEKNG